MQIYKYVIKISKFAPMKKITSLLFLIIVLITSCETDFDVNAEWEEITVVFGLLDQSQEKQYIRINKAFLGEESVSVMALVADSLNYNPVDLEVKIQRVSDDNTVLGERILTDTIMYKEDGMFATENNIIYVFDKDHFLQEDKDYILTVTNLKSGKIITSKTNLIHGFNLISFANSSPRMGFYSIQLEDFSSTTVKWTHSKNASIYQMSLKIHYSEYSPTATVEDSIIKVFPIVNYSGSSDMKQTISGEEFFSFIANSVPMDNNVTRRINSVDVLFSVGSSTLNTYINLNEPPTGIVQERPVYTNIEGGIGLFSCRYNYVKEGIELATDTKKAIAEQLDSLNFIYP